MPKADVRNLWLCASHHTSRRKCIKQVSTAGTLPEAPTLHTVLRTILCTQHIIGVGDVILVVTCHLTCPQQHLWASGYTDQNKF